MYRRVVLSKSTPTSGSVNITVLYHVRGAMLLSQYRRYAGKYIASASFGQLYFPVVFDDAIKFGLGATINDLIAYEFILDVDENQPEIESVEEITSQGIIVTVYNADGVLVCRNTPITSSGSAPEQTDGPGEMTSVPGEEPGEMAGETTGEPGAMI